MTLESDTDTTTNRRETRLTRGSLVKGGLVAAGATMFAGVPEAAARVFITKKSVTLNLWTWGWPTILPNTNVDPVKQSFEKRHSNITLNVKIFGYPDYLVAMRTGLPARSFGDLFLIPIASVGRQYHNFMLPLDSFVARDFPKNYKKQYLPGVFHLVQRYSPQGQLLAMPILASIGSIMWYSQKALAKVGVGVPKSYAELRSQVPKYKAAGIVPIAWGAKDLWSVPDWVVSNSSQFKPNIATDAEIGKASFTHPALVATLEFIAQSVKEGVYNADPFSTNNVPDALLNGFDAGKAAMASLGTYWRGFGLTVPGAQDDWRGFLFPRMPGAPNRRTFTGVASGFPVATGNNPSRPWSTATGFAIRKGVSKKTAAAAWEFLADGMSYKGQQSYAGWNSTSRRDIHLHRIHPEFGKFLDWQNSLFEIAVLRDFLYPEVNDAITSAVANVVVNGQNARSALAAVDKVAKQARKKG